MVRSFVEIASIAIETVLLTWKQETVGLEGGYSEWKGSEVLTFFLSLCWWQAYTMDVAPFFSVPREV